MLVNPLLVWYTLGSDSDRMAIRFVTPENRWTLCLKLSHVPWQSINRNLPIFSDDEACYIPVQGIYPKRINFLPFDASCAEWDDNKTCDWHCYPKTVDHLLLKTRGRMEQDVEIEDEMTNRTGISLAWWDQIYRRLCSPDRPASDTPVGLCLYCVRTRIHLRISVTLSFIPNMNK